MSRLQSTPWLRTLAPAGLLAALLLAAGARADEPAPLPVQLPAALPAPLSVTLCEEANYAPFFFLPRPVTGNAASQPTGFTMELVTAVLAEAGVSWQLQILPWNRCMDLVAAGDIDIGMDAYHDAARARRFSYSAPYFRLTPQYFYDRHRPGGPLRLRKPADFHRYQACGLNSYSYDHYGPVLKRLDQSAESYEQLFSMLQARRCDYFFEEKEVMAGTLALRAPDAPALALASGPVPGATAPELHFILRREGARSAQLRAILNAGIARMQRDGRLAALARKYW